jgi:hypothetical protein
LLAVSMTAMSADALLGTNSMRCEMSSFAAAGRAQIAARTAAANNRAGRFIGNLPRLNGLDGSLVAFAVTQATGARVIRRRTLFHISPGVNARERPMHGSASGRALS